VDDEYKKGIKLSYRAKTALEKRLDRSPSLWWWDIRIKPKTVF